MTHLWAGSVAPDGWSRSAGQRAGQARTWGSPVGQADGRGPLCHGMARDRCANRGGHALWPHVGSHYAGQGLSAGRVVGVYWSACWPGTSWSNRGGHVRCARMWGSPVGRADGRGPLCHGMARDRCANPGGHVLRTRVGSHYAGQVLSARRVVGVYRSACWPGTSWSNRGGHVRCARMWGSSVGRADGRGPLCHGMARDRCANRGGHVLWTHV